MYPYRISWLIGVRIPASKESGSNRLTKFTVLWCSNYLHCVLTDLASGGDHDQGEHLDDDPNEIVLDVNRANMDYPAKP
jgi:hypothetical protein